MPRSMHMCAGWGRVADGHAGRLCCAVLCCAVLCCAVQQDCAAITFSQGISTGCAGRSAAAHVPQASRHGANSAGMLCAAVLLSNCPCSQHSHSRSSRPDSSSRSQQLHSDGQMEIRGKAPGMETVRQMSASWRTPITSARAQGTGRAALQGKQQPR